MLPPKSFQLYQTVVTAAAEIEAALGRAPTVEQVIQMDGDILGNMTDAIYALRESFNLADNIRKAINKQFKEMQQAACAAYMSADIHQQSLLNEAGRAVGEYATGKPSTKTAVSILKREKNPSLYDRFCRECLGVTNDELIHSGAVEVHYVYFSDWVTNQIAEGKCLPEVLSEMKQYNELGFDVVKKKPILS